MSYYGRGGNLISLNEEIWPSVAYFWCENPLPDFDADGDPLYVCVKSND